MAIITVFSTKGKKRSSVETDVNTWGELKEVLGKEGIETSGFKAIVGETQTTLESSKAVLPKGLTNAGEVTKDFTLFLTPVKTKSGAPVNVDDMSYWDCRNFIKEEFAGSDEAKEHFAGYTNKDTATLRSLIKSWTNTPVNEEVSDEELSSEQLIDNCIASLEAIKVKIQAGAAVKEDVVDEVEVLNNWFEEIKANM